jgi:alkanesulfonate monooxygenase
VAAAQEKLAASESESQRRISELHGRGAGYEQGGDPHDLEVYPGLWTGVGLVRGGAGTALVGSYDEVAALIGEYAAQGVDELVLSGYPHLEETFHVGQGLVPALRRRGFGVTNHGPAFADAGAGVGAGAGVTA